MPPFEFAKSSYSSGNGECVEGARNIPHTIAVRDSKNAAGPILTLSPAAWAPFAGHLARKGSQLP
ncbi:DUF397 domain-containing protein [Streptomyces sp. FXJ1.172]|uniref:DUF397 domain-containing protein n=1 Tax=Streptomyces sp. FXJ1.172 TaxID=710705 RepID=UPI0007CF1BED|nr:DUF397 domain-containing protein [Streptomyces sp. FXJ1.172]WEO96364.1 DUF397 domain-containing protein [Streptomyces sp. FXJ1.172]